MNDQDLPHVSAEGAAFVARHAAQRGDLERVAEDMPAAIAVWDISDSRNARLKYANRAFRGAFGQSPDQKLGTQSIHEVLSQALNQPLTPEQIEVVKHSGSVTMPGTIVDPEGGVRRIQRVFKLVDSQNPTEMIAVGVDEDARLRDEPAEPGPGGEQFADIDVSGLVDVVPAQVALWEIEGDGERLIYANPALQQFLSEVSDAAPARASSMADFLEDDPGRPPIERVKAWARGSVVRNYERVVTDRAGRDRHLLVTLYPLPGSVPARYITLGIDVTEQRSAEGSAKAAQREAEYGLTAREREVLELIAAGKSTAATAEALGVSLNTVKWHVKQILAKTSTRSRAAAVERVYGNPSPQER